LSSRVAGAREYAAEVCAHIPVAVGVGRSAPSQPSPGWSVAPSAAYPLSPRRREIIRAPLKDRAGADVNVNAQPSIRDRPLARERRQEKSMRRMPPFTLPTIHDGVVVVARIGVILPKVVTSTGTQARQNLGCHGSSKRLDDKILSLTRSLRRGQSRNGLAWLGTSAIETVALAGSPQGHHHG